MQELYHYTQEKSEYLSQKGCNVVEIRECDVYRKLKQNEEMKYYFDHYYIGELLDPCRALFGGRTNAAKLYHCCRENK